MNRVHSASIIAAAALIAAASSAGGIGSGACPVQIEYGGAPQPPFIERRPHRESWRKRGGLGTAYRPKRKRR